ncbi:hypothetical protein EJ04DRAFT_609162 [Polyplosphaeria fusca]|uniref:Zn(2)-C6 fungal-type domain-containing protein n=1 Tax=Polyplosphaeria fusca TaxID=682080 RepID=A0A9P4V0C0_9PLEO|nr:hypothetical protein EJ04DRAFT_609162 [Polyplosphaeria fusca]
MPGVPTSRGCDACRKQKKKCNQAKPRCSRCVRLDIECKGSGQQRWKFQEHVQGTGTSSMRNQVLQLSLPQQSPSPRHSPTSPTSTTSSRLVHLLQTSDLRYDITVFGEFWAGIPRRLGESQALDAAVYAFTCSHSNVYNSDRSTESLVAFGTALRNVRTAISDPRQIYTPHVLCAVHILSITQRLIDSPGDPFFEHTEIIAHILPGMIQQSWPPGSLGYSMLIHATLSVLFTCIYRHDIPLHPSLNNLMRAYVPERPFTSATANPLRSLGMHNLMRLPYFLRHPEDHVDQIRDAYALVLEDFPAIRARLACLKEGREEDVAIARSRGIEVRKLHAQYQVAYGGALALGLLENGILRALGDERDDGGALEEEAEDMSEHALELGRDMLGLRPLAASACYNVLSIAWGLEGEGKRREALREVLVEYRRLGPEDRDFFGGGEWVRTYMNRLRKRHQRKSVDVDRAGDAYGMLQDDPRESEALPTVGRCTIL